MRDHRTIDGYLREVDAYLHVDPTQRRRVLVEIEGYLLDAVEAHVASGLQPDLAIDRAVEELGTPPVVAMEFSAGLSPWRSVRGWRRWLPMVLPAMLLAIDLLLIVWSLSWVRGGLTLGEQQVQRSYLVHAGVMGVLASCTYVAIRMADRDPAWRRAAWFCAGFSLFVAVAIG